MKRIIPALCTLAALLALPAQADRYKVVKFNSSAILIDNKKVEVGMVFDDNSTITWTKNEQAVQVYNFTAKRQQLMVANGVNRQRKQTIMEVISSVHHLSTHEQAGQPQAERTDYGLLRDAIADEYYMFDQIDIATSMAFSHGKSIIISYTHDEEIVEKEATLRGSHIIIPRDLFKVGRSASRDLIVNIDLVSADNPQQDPSLTAIKRGVRLHILPLKI